jgi:glycerol-3-phosphate dehydrogenase
VVAIYDAVIIGAGITGAAVAYELSKYELSLAVLEKENDAAMGATRANSAVIHAGYDPLPGTLMARLNVQGAALAKILCRKLDVPHRVCGSMVLAFDGDDAAHLHLLFERGQKNGAAGLEIVDGQTARRLEGRLSREVTGALLANETMIVNPWEYALALLETAVRNGARFFPNRKVSALKREEGLWFVSAGNGTEAAFVAKNLINAAGVHAVAIHNLAAPPEFTIEPRRGEYFLLDKSEGEPVSRVIFQCPTTKGKGVLVAPTVHGNTLAGPTSDTAGGPDDTACTAYGLAEIMEKARKSVPSLNFKSGIRNFAGLRAHTGQGDFIIKEAAPGFFDAAGIASPGLSAAPAVARLLADLLSQSGVPLVPKKNFNDTRKVIRFSGLSTREKAALVNSNPRYGRIICRCETVSEGEILDALSGPLPPGTLDGIKRRCGPGLGRCQGGFCGSRVTEILSRWYNIDPSLVEQDRSGSFVLVSGALKEKCRDL